MRQKDYNKAILRRLECGFDKVLPLASFVAFISSFAISFSATIPRLFVTLNAGIGILLLLVSVFHNQLAIETKIIISTAIPIVIGVLAFIDGGFSSAALSLFFISNVVVVLFLKKNISYIFSTISILCLLAMWIWAGTKPVDNIINIGWAKWFIQITTYSFCLLVLHLVVYTIKKYLLESIKKLESNIEQIYDLAYFDQLTGVPNQFLFKERLAARIRAGHTGYLVFFSIKNLNIINSIYGNEVGDTIMLEAAQVFAELIEDNEMLGRADGNEFVVHLNDDPKRLNNMVEQFHARFSAKNIGKKVLFHIGCAQINKCASSQDCYRKGTLALTHAKTHDISDIVFYNQALHEAVNREEEIKEQLEQALTAGEITLYYQTKVDALTEGIVGVEALARWHSSSLGNIPPGVFVPILEKMSLSIAFGELVIKMALADYQALRRKYHHDIMLSINISPTHLMTEGFVPFLDNTTKAYGVNNEQIVLEITEEILIQGLHSAKERILELKGLGFKISLDDFGSGYSSLNYLMSMEIDELKIDKSFIDQIEVNGKICTMLEYLVKFFQTYGLEVIAEGVETKSQRDILVQLGCRTLQGYYYSKPKPLV